MYLCVYIKIILPAYVSHLSLALSVLTNPSEVYIQSLL